ncbi:unnamed protein product [Orchesella dallaii]|uniref:Odorant receptor n=1 Tax=Orchesella dallaii TaxID=48710 RepID=A0ABP1RMB5_9HEXA
MTIQVAPNPKFSRYHKSVWYFLKVCMQVLAIICIFRCLYLFQHRLGHLDWEQLSIYVLILINNLTGITCYWTMFKYPTQISFLVEQSINMRKLKPSKFSFSKPPKFQEMMVYGSVMLPIVMTMTPFVTPLFRSYDTAQLIFTHILGNNSSYTFARRIMGSLVWGIPSIISNTLIFNLILVMLVIVENAISLSTSVHFGTSASMIKYLNSYLSGLTIIGNRWGKIAHRSENIIRFTRRLEHYRQLQILLCVTNGISYRCLFVFLYCGGVALVTSIYIVVKLRHEIPLLIVLGSGIFLIMGELTAVIMLTLAARPHEYSKAFRDFWKHLLKTKFALKQLRSCATLGFSCGPIPVVKADTFLTLHDVVLNATATILLIQ